MPASRPVCLLVLFAMAAFSTGLIAAEPADQAGTELFERKIRPVLVKHCYRCHSAEAKKVGGQFLLDNRAALRAGGESGPAIVPHRPEDSLLLDAIRHDGYEMPPDRKLPPRVIADFEQWIAMGAPDPRVGEDGVRPPAAEIDFSAAKRFWSFQPPQSSSLPQVADMKWLSRPIDAFIARGLDESGIQPNPAAERRLLLRRASYDLLGLAPAKADIDRFAADPAPDAFQRQVDRLLALPQFGERWTRLWLDLARYAEDQAHIVGNNKSLFFPNAHLYRDWLIEAFNADLPYDRFVRLQLAADLAEPDSEQNLVALGFLGLGPKYYRRNSPEVMADEWEDRVDVVTRGLLGLTVACARCHDHKFDPIETEDYYALAGIFASTEMFNRPLTGQDAGDDGQAKQPDKAMHIVRDKDPHDIPVFIRGDVNNVGDLVPRRFVRVVCGTTDPAVFRQGSGRLQLANAIVDPENPLTARVFVNRVWAAQFGQPLVATPSNFGSLGTRPTHPRLLDRLAIDFVAGQWSIKRLIGRIVTSSTYQQSSDAAAAQVQADPTNKWLGRMNRKRLRVEAWRDSLLQAADRLDLCLGGPSIDVQDPLHRRRTVYAEVSRFSLNPMLAMFDFPDPNNHAAGRSETTTPLQKLFVMNNRFVTTQAESLAAFVLAQNPHEDQSPRAYQDAHQNQDSSAANERAAVRTAFLQVYQRPPSADEVRISLDFLSSVAGDRLAKWQQYAHALLASNELLFVD